jgi:hypothetical protein
MASISSAEISNALLYGSNWWAGPSVTYSVPSLASAWTSYAVGKEPTDPAYAVLNAVRPRASQPPPRPGTRWSACR